MIHTDASQILRRVLFTDALICALFGMFLCATAAPLAAFTGLATGLLFPAGIALLPIAAFMAFTAMRRSLHVFSVQAIVAGNVVWVVGSVVALVLSPGVNSWGAALVVGQAATVAGLLTLEWIGLRRLQSALKVALSAGRD